MNANWEKRYEEGGIGPGAGSQGNLFKYKLETIQDLVKKYKIKSLLDIGCGDGRQLRDLAVKEYHGLDISDTGIRVAISKKKPHQSYGLITAPYTKLSRPMQAHVSLDVLHCLPVGAPLDGHMDTLFDAKEIVILYCENIGPEGLGLASHMHFHKVDDYIAGRYRDWEPVEVLENPYAAKTVRDQGKTFAKFHIYKRINE